MRTAFLNDLIAMKQYVDVMQKTVSETIQRREYRFAGSTLDSLIWKVRHSCNYRTGIVDRGLTELEKIADIRPQVLKARRDYNE